jgi:hypothetical protein
VATQEVTAGGKGLLEAQSGAPADILCRPVMAVFGLERDGVEQGSADPVEPFNFGNNRRPSRSRIGTSAGSPPSDVAAIPSSPSKISAIRQSASRLPLNVLASSSRAMGSLTF